MNITKYAKSTLFLLLMTVLAPLAASAQGEGNQTWGPHTLPGLDGLKVKVEVSFLNGDEDYPVPETICIEGADGIEMCVKDGGPGDVDGREDEAIEVSYKKKRIEIDRKSKFAGALRLLIDGKAYYLFQDGILQPVQTTATQALGLSIGDLLDQGAEAMNVH